MPDERLAARWLLNEGEGTVARDAVHRLDGRLGGRGKAKTANRGPVWINGRTTMGKKGKALRFDAHDFVEVEDTCCLEPQRLTVECWVRGSVSDHERSNAARLHAYVLSKGAAGRSAASYALYTGLSGGIEFYVATVDGVWTSVALPPPAAGGAPSSRIWDGAWHHVAGTFAPGTLELYLDGVAVATGTGPAAIGYSPVLTNSRFYIGNYDPVNTNEFGFTGDIDESAVWGRVLPAAELATHAAR